MIHGVVKVRDISISHAKDILQYARHVLVIGCSGGGKTTLALNLAKRYKLQEEAEEEAWEEAMEEEQWEPPWHAYGRQAVQQAEEEEEQEEAGGGQALVPTPPSYPPPIEAFQAYGVDPPPHWWRQVRQRQQR